MYLVIHAKNVQFMACPAYEGLTITDILKNVGMKNDFRLYMPVLKEILRLPKQFILNTALTICGDGFKQWVRTQIETRNQKVTKEKDLLISIDPEVAQAWQHSTAVSVSAHFTQSGCGITSASINPIHVPEDKATPALRALPGPEFGIVVH